MAEKKHLQRVIPSWPHQYHSPHPLATGLSIAFSPVIKAGIVRRGLDCADFSSCLAERSHQQLYHWYSDNWRLLASKIYACLSEEVFQLLRRKIKSSGTSSPAMCGVQTMEQTQPRPPSQPTAQTEPPQRRGETLMVGSAGIYPHEWRSLTRLAYLILHHESFIYYINVYN
jgi:hypothetical protein